MFGVEDRFPAPERFSGASDALHALAASLIGADDFGEDHRLGLRVLLESMDYDPHFSERGRRVAWGQLLSALSSRGRAFRAMKAVPDLDRIAIERPVVITGLHRTGTTALHKLLAVDPQFQGLEGWLSGAPKPRPPRSAWDGDPEYREMVDRLEARFAAVPGMRAAHESLAGEVDECVGVLMQSFVSTIWTVAWSAASYDAWWQTQSERPAYRYHRDVLRLIGSNDRDRCWLLKEPSHINTLDLLFETYPDARVIQTHRDPGKAIPSLCSLLIQQHPLMEVDRLDQRARMMGLRETARSARAVEKAQVVKDARSDQVLDVRHADFHRDPMAVIGRIYPFLGLELSPQVEQAMRERIAEAPERSHGEHSYDARDFGTTEAEIRERFGSYIDRFDLRPRA
jgi:hypothetical protein